MSHIPGLALNQTVLVLIQEYKALLFMVWVTRYGSVITQGLSGSKISELLQP